jgi:hypothetical protein
MNKFKITLASDLNKNEMKSEFDYQDANVGAIIEREEQPDKLLIEIYRPANTKYWEFPLDDFLAAIEEAKKRLQQKE